MGLLELTLFEFGPLSVCLFVGGSPLLWRFLLDDLHHFVIDYGQVVLRNIFRLESWLRHLVVEQVHLHALDVCIQVVVALNWVRYNLLRRRNLLFCRGILSNWVRSWFTLDLCVDRYLARCLIYLVGRQGSWGSFCHVTRGWSCRLLPLVDWLVL